ncbi:MAG: MarP family serine protease [Actinomycetota bacterium]|nr:MarP family serine protease [Actinomycetota bacterium]
MTFAPVDAVLLLSAAVVGVSGYRRGLVVGVLSLAGLCAGIAAAAHFAPELAENYLPGRNSAVLGLVAIVVGAVVGSALGTAAGSAVRRKLPGSSARAVDAGSGAVVSVLVLLLLAWLAGTALVQSPLTQAARQVQRSAVLSAVDDAMPDAASTWFPAFRRLIDREGLGTAFGGLGAERIVPVDPPDAGAAVTPAVRQASRSVVRVLGVAPSCAQSNVGSGFVYAPRRVMTNAHVLAGVRRPQVVVPGSARPLDARVVVYDPDRDVAVLYVPDLEAPVLRFRGPAAAGADAIVAGYPGGGPYTTVPARIRAMFPARGPDIYHTQIVTRQVYSVRSQVRPGNSGGPLLAPDGTVYGVVFAAGVGDAATGYVLTAREVSSAANAGAESKSAVSTRGCD